MAGPGQCQQHILQHPKLHPREVFMLLKRVVLLHDWDQPSRQVPLQ